MKTYSRGNHSLSLVICILLTTEVIISGCGSTYKQDLKPNQNQRVVSFRNYNRPSEKPKSFILSAVNLPLSITALNYSYVVPFSKGAQEVEQQEHKFKRKSAFETFQKYANKIRRYEKDDDFDSFNFNLKGYNFKQQGHWNSNYQDVITSKRNDSWILKYNTSELNSNLDSHSFHISENKSSNDTRNESITIDRKRINGNFNHQSNLISGAGLYKNVCRRKRELNHLDNNRPRHDKTAKETKASARSKRKKGRKHGRMYFDKKESSTNVTILNGQTAFLTCTVRNVGNKSVSWLRLTKNPIPQILGMDNKIYTKDPRYSVIHNSDDPKLREVFVLRIRHTRLSDGGRYECQVSANSRRKGARSRAIYHVISLDVVEPITWIVGGPQIIVDRGSTLNMTCIVSTRSKPPDFIIWGHSDRTILYEGPDPDQALPPAYSNQSISSTWPTDSRGRFISNLVIHNVTHKHAGEYKCEPAASRPAKITVHVQNGTDPLAVSDNGDGISSGLNGGVRPGTKLVSTHTSFDKHGTIDQKRQHNGAMLKDKFIEKTQIIDDNRRARNKELIENNETDLNSGSNTHYLSAEKLITIGCLLAAWRPLQI